MQLPHLSRWLPAGLAALVLTAGLAPVQTGDARQFRRINPIVTPTMDRAREGEPVTRLTPVPRDLVRNAVEGIVADWNTPHLERWLAEDFVDRTRLADTVNEVAPRDGRLELLGMGAVATLDQRVRGSDGERRRRVSLVSTVVRLQFIHQDPATGFRRLEGEQEFVLRVEEPLP